MKCACLSPTLIDLNLVEVKYYSFMISLDKYNESCNVLSPKIFVAKKKNDINVKVFNMIANKNEAKTMKNSTTCNSNQK